MNNLSIVIIITSVCIYISGWENEIEKLFCFGFAFLTYVQVFYSFFKF